MLSLREYYNESKVKSRTRERILSAACELFTENDFDRVSMHDVAEAVEITYRNLYRYYPNKEALIIDTVYRAITLYPGEKEYPFAEHSTLSGVELLEDVLGYHIGYHSIDQQMLKFLLLINRFDYYLNTLDEFSEAVVKYKDVYAKNINISVRQDIMRALLAGIEDGSLNLEGERPEDVTECLFQASVSLMARIMVKEKERDVFNPELVRLHTKILIRGLSAR